MMNENYEKAKLRAERIVKAHLGDSKRLNKHLKKAKENVRRGLLIGDDFIRLTSLRYHGITVNFYYKVGDNENTWTYYRGRKKPMHYSEKTLRKFGYYDEEEEDDFVYEIPEIRNSGSLD